MSKFFTGHVIKHHNTCAKVEVIITKIHPLYKKRYKIHHCFQIFDPKNLCKVGDFVEFSNCRPITKNIHFKINKVIKWYYPIVD